MFQVCDDEYETKTIIACLWENESCILDNPLKSSFREEQETCALPSIVTSLSWCNLDKR